MGYHVDLYFLLWLYYLVGPTICICTCVALLLTLNSAVWIIFESGRTYRVGTAFAFLSPLALFYSGTHLLHMHIHFGV